MELAESKDFNIVDEYVDAVESAKTTNRPAFQRLISDIKDRGRGWDNVIFLDTSRLSRRRFHAQVFKHECKRHGVELHFSHMPDLDPITTVIVESVFEAMDEVHSIMSREKGLAGMAENVRQGFRAGGRAPFGYQLKKIPTGAFREGKEVTKSKLIPSSDAPLIKRYLKMRAKGTARTFSASQTGLNKKQTSLIGFEWNALTYAGHTVWNVHNAHLLGEGYQGKAKRRPRSEWIVSRNTHKALINDIEAESIIEALENSSSKRQPRRKHFYLLSGLIQSFDGQKYHGDGGNYYAIKSGTSKIRVNREEIESIVLKMFAKDLSSKKFVDGILESAKRQVNQSKQDLTPMIKKRLEKITSKINKLIDFGMKLEDDEPVIRQINELEKERSQVSKELKDQQLIQSADNALSNITREQVEKMLEGLGETLAEQEPESLRALLESKIEKIEVDKPTNRVKITYAIGVKMASPRGFEPLLPP